MLIKNIAGIVSVRDRVAGAQREVERLQNDQNALRRKVEQATSAAYIEEVVRNKLGLGRAGETVVVLPNEDFLKNLAPALENGEKELKKFNWQKWVDKFF